MLNTILFSIGLIVIGIVATFLLSERWLKPSGLYNIDETTLNANNIDWEQPADHPSVTIWSPKDLPLDQPSPLILYFGGWSGDQIDNPYLLQNLVSHGYTLAILTYEKTDSFAATERYKPMIFSSKRDYEETQERAEKRLEQRVSDAITLINKLSNTSRDFHLDITKVGVIGYSFGGAIAAELAHSDNRVIAAINLDGWLFGQALKQGVSAGFMIISDNTKMPSKSDLNHTDTTHRYTSLLTQQSLESIEKNMAIHGGDFVQISETGHRHFADRHLHFWPFRLGWMGRLSGIKAYDIISHYSLRFFGQSLRNKPFQTDRLSAAKYPQAVLTHWPKSLTNSD